MLLCSQHGGDVQTQAWLTSVLHGNTSDGETGTFPGTWREHREGATLLRAAEEIAPRGFSERQSFPETPKA